MGVSILRQVQGTTAPTDRNTLFGNTKLIKTALFTNGLHSGIPQYLDTYLQLYSFAFKAPTIWYELCASPHR